SAVGGAGFNASSWDGGGGGGGRIAVYYGTDNSTITYLANGGTGGAAAATVGGAGTLYLDDSDDTLSASLIVNNATQVTTAVTPLFITGQPSNYTFNNFSVLNAAVLTVASPGVCPVGGHAVIITGVADTSGGGSVTRTLAAGEDGVNTVHCMNRPHSYVNIPAGLTIAAQPTDTGTYDFYKRFTDTTVTPNRLVIGLHSDLQYTNTDVDLTGETYDADATKTVMSNFSSTNLAAFHALYIPNSNGSNGVRICPNATTLAGITSSCSGGVTFTSTQVDGLTFKTVGSSLTNGVRVKLVNAADDGGALANDTTDLYRIEGLRNSGAGPLATTLTISGTCKQADNSTNCADSESVKVAINGTLDASAGTTGTPASGQWTLTTTASVNPGDVLTVFVNGVAEAQEAAAVTVWDGVGTTVTNVQLIEERLTLGSDDNQTITNANISSYDSSVSADEDIFFDVANTTNDLDTDSEGGHTNNALLIATGDAYRPDSASSGNVLTGDLRIDGTMTADGNTITVEGDWANSGTFNYGTSTVDFHWFFSAITLDSGGTGAGNAFYNLSVRGFDTLTLVNNNLEIQNDLVVGGGTFSPGSFTVSAGTLSVWDGGNFSGGTGSVSTGNLSFGNNGTDLNGDFTIDNGSFTAPSTTLNITGNLNGYNDFGSTFTHNGGTIRFIGTSNQDLHPNNFFGDPTSITLNNLEIENTGAGGSNAVRPRGTVTIEGSLTVTDGGLDLNTSDPVVSVANDVAIATDGNISASNTAAFTVSGGWDNVPGSTGFTHNNGEITFDDNGQTSRITGANTFYDFTSVTPSKVLDFQGGVTQIIANTLDIDGQAGGTQITLTSSDLSTWTFDVTAGDQTVSNVDVSYGNADSNDIYALGTSTNSGNNDDGDVSPHWIFDNTPPTGTITYDHDGVGGDDPGADFSQDTDTVTLIGTATDVGTGDSGVTLVEVSINNGGIWASATNTGTNFSTWSYLATLADGVNQVRIRVTDGATNVQTYTTNSITTDGTDGAQDITYLFLTLSAMSDFLFGTVPMDTLASEENTLGVSTNSQTGYTVQIKKQNTDPDTTMQRDPSGEDFPDLLDWISGTPNSAIWSSPSSALGFRLKSTGDANAYNSSWWGSDDTSPNAKFGGFPDAYDTMINDATLKTSAGSPYNSVLQLQLELEGSYPIPAGTYSGVIEINATVIP
ncbi:MAG: hypothetical protein Q8O95_05805, partial [bacterium]|nr:hypothetical protein [bacterium]